MIAGSAGLHPVRSANDRVNLAFIGAANVEHAAQIPGFQIVARGEEADEILADPFIDAVCISAPAAMQADLTVRACEAGKDVYVEAPAIATLDEGPRIVDAARRCRRVVQAGGTLRSGAMFRRARETVRSGELGDITFCRVLGGTDPMPLIDLVQFLFGDPEPVSLDAQSGAGQVGITLRYRGFIASYQSSSCPGGLWIHGTGATLALNGSDPAYLPDWQNFLDCIRTRRRPAADIEACVRSTMVCLRARQAMRHNWVSA